MPHIAGPNHTQIPNVILESMDTLGNAELRIVLAVCRKTFGWQKRQDRLSLTQLQSLTGLSRQGTIDGIEDAIRNEWIVREPYGQSFVYAVNLVDQSTSQASRQEVVKPVDQLGKKLVKPVDIQKKELKETERKEDEDAPPKFSRPFLEYERNIGALVPMLKEELDKLISETSEAAVLHGITQAVGANARNLRYISACARALHSGADVSRGRSSQRRSNGGPRLTVAQQELQRIQNGGGDNDILGIFSNL